MKQLTKIVALIAAILFAGSPSAFAVTTSTPATSISATVDQVLSLSIGINEETSPGPPPVLCFWEQIPPAGRIRSPHR